MYKTIGSSCKANNKAAEKYSNTITRILHTVSCYTCTHTHAHAHYNFLQQVQHLHTLELQLSCPALNYRMLVQTTANERNDDLLDSKYAEKQRNNKKTTSYVNCT